MEQLFEVINYGEDLCFTDIVKDFQIQELNKGCGGVSTMTHAVLCNNLSALQALITRGCNVNVTSEVYDEEKKLCRFETPLITSARLGGIAQARMLLDANAITDITDHGVGKSALHWACARGHKAVVDILLKKGACVDQLDYYCETPIVEAIGRRNIDLVQALVEYGADVNRPLNYDHDSALTLSLVFNAFNIAKYLIQIGSYVSAMNKDGDDPLKITLSMRIKQEQIVHLVLMLVFSSCKIKQSHFDRLHMLQPLDFHLHVKELLNSVKTSPLSLSRLSRISVRNTLTDLYTPRLMLEKINSLPCPTRIIQFLSFEIL